MATSYKRTFLTAIPKTDLHLHLDGSLRVETLIELARAQHVELPSYSPAGLRESVFKPAYRNLAEYLAGFRYTCAVLQDTESLARVACELAEDSLAEGVRYIEVRFAPQLHVQDGLGLIDTIRAVNDGLAAAARQHNTSEAVRRGGDLPFCYSIIACAMRTFNRHMSPYFARLFDLLPETPVRELVAIASEQVVRAAVTARDRDGLPVTGFDLAGEEAGFPAATHKRAYAFAHSHFLCKTVHAGEAYGPESIFQALTDCHANRIGHGTFLFSPAMIKDPQIKDPARYVEALAEYVARRRITIEVCLTSNLQTTPGITSIATHPVCNMLKHNCSVSLCTDNRLVSNTSVTQELTRLTEAVDIPPETLQNIIVAGFKGSFFPGTYNEKRTYVRRVMARYRELADNAALPG